MLRQEGMNMKYNFCFHFLLYKQCSQHNYLLWIWWKHTTENYVNGSMNITTCCMKSLNIKGVICETQLMHLL